MVQESIVEYINSQMKLGVSRDAIKTTLTGAGWQAADVEDTFKKVEAAKPAIAAQSMSAMSSIAATSPAKPAMSASGGSVSPAPQTIRVSDLVSSSASAAPMTMSSKPAVSSPASGPASTPASRSPLTGPTAFVAGATAGTKSSNTFQAQSFSAGKVHGSRGALITDIVLIIIIIIVGGFAGFLYMQNGSLTTKLSSLNGQSTGVNSQLSALQAQVAASTTALTAQTATLTAETQELQTELSFYAVPVGAAPGGTITVSFNGTVSGGGKTSYVITAMYGAKIYVTNSKDASVISAMAPLLATSAATSTSKTATSTASSTAATSTPSVSAASSTPTTAQFSGTYVPGSDSITLTSVNGTSL